MTDSDKPEQSDHAERAYRWWLPQIVAFPFVGTWWLFDRLIVRNRARNLDPPVPRPLQLFYMSIVTLVGFIVIAAFKNGATHHHIPDRVWILETAIVLGCLAASYDAAWDIMETSAIAFGFMTKKSNLAKVPSWWERWRKDHGHMLIALGVVANMYALYRVVQATGGPLKSPFAVMLTGPALFGAFVAHTVLGLAELVAVVNIVIIVLDRNSRGSDTGQWYAYAFPQVALLTAAFVISLFQILRDREQRSRRRRRAA